MSKKKPAIFRKFFTYAVSVLILEVLVALLHALLCVHNAWISMTRAYARTSTRTHAHPEANIYNTQTTKKKLYKQTIKKAKTRQANN
jgi:hypothetical protein